MIRPSLAKSVTQSGRPDAAFSAFFPLSDRAFIPENFVASVRSQTSSNSALFSRPLKSQLSLRPYLVCSRLRKTTVFTQLSTGVEPQCDRESVKVSAASLRQFRFWANAKSRERKTFLRQKATKGEEGEASLHTERKKDRLLFHPEQSHFRFGSCALSP